MDEEWKEILVDFIWLIFFVFIFEYVVIKGKLMIKKENKEIINKLNLLGYKTLNIITKDNSTLTVRYDGYNYYVKIFQYNKLTKEFINEMKRQMNEIHYYQGILILGNDVIGFDGEMDYSKEKEIHIMGIKSLTTFSAEVKETSEESISDIKETEENLEYEGEDGNPIKSIGRSYIDKLKGPDKL